MNPSLRCCFVCPEVVDGVKSVAGVGVAEVRVVVEVDFCSLVCCFLVCTVKASK